MKELNLEPKDSFIILKQKDNTGPLYKVTMCSKTLKPIDMEPFTEIPNEWSVQDFYDYLDEGKKFNI